MRPRAGEVDIGEDYFQTDARDYLSIEFESNLVKITSHNIN